MKLRNSIAVATALAAAISLAGCAQPANAPDESSPSVDASSRFNDADVMFAQMMIPHHQQAIDMAETMIAKDGAHPRVLDLAERIKATQGPEIEQLETMLDGWGAESDIGMPGMDHGGTSGGMMSEDDMAALEEASGQEADRLFLEQMIMHHEGAIEMAEAELADGVNPDATGMAQDIVDAQRAEIAEMEDILSTLE